MISFDDFRNVEDTQWWRFVHMQPWWHHQLETFCVFVALCAGSSPVTGEFPWQASDAEIWRFRWSVPEKNAWVNKRGAGDFSRHRAHYDAIVMTTRNTWRHQANESTYSINNLGKYSQVRRASYFQALQSFKMLTGPLLTINYIY